MPLQVQYQNLVMSSFVLYLNNLLLSKGGYTNVGTRFYPSNTIFNGYSAYNAPYKPINFDSSYSTTVMTGVYVNGSYLTLNQSGYAGVDFNRASVYFTGSNTPIISVVSGNYSIPEYNILFPAPDISMIFENKMALVNRNKTPLNTANTGLNSSEITYPVIFVRSESFSNKPHEFGGVDLTTTSIGCYIFSDNAYSFDAIRSIFADEKYQYFALFDTGELPTNNINSLKSIYSGGFNYTGIANLSSRIGNNQAMFINDVVSTNFSNRGLFAEVASLPSDVYFGIVEFEVNKPRLT